MTTERAPCHCELRGLCTHHQYAFSTRERKHLIVQLSSIATLPFTAFVPEQLLHVAKLHCISMLRAAAARAHELRFFSEGLASVSKVSKAMLACWASFTLPGAIG
jgi:hypothetical protein